MKVYEYGNKTSDIVLIQLVDEHDLALIKNEVAAIIDNSHNFFKLLAVKV